MKLITICLLILQTMQVVAQTEYDSDRGFAHPGGLHTQEDFDRVKQQLRDGNVKVTQAYNILMMSEYAQPSVQTYPTEIIVRGGGTGENYMNAARGAAMAYQNALRWKIEDNTQCAEAAVRILMAWARTTKGIGGDSNYALAAGLYGYQFAQAAELMRDYEGWSREDFKDFKDWMLRVWYESSIGFLRGRNGTWENVGKWWQAPGHYWSNWGLCNALCVISIGILCDDVFIYNQGMSYIKYDQCGTFTDPRTEVPIKNDGLTEFMGNFVVTTYESDLETGAYGRLGQLNESGRDAGHSAMSLGLMLDVAKVAWSQGDDLFMYMDHRLAAGVEYLAAQALSVEGLPWVDYIYGTNGYYYTDSRCWTMTEPAMGAQMRPYWGTVIGIYEGVKGVVMPFAESAYANMGIDGGGAGSTSGGYDHLGFSVLMNTRDVQLCPAVDTPTELTSKMMYNGNIVFHNELGGLVNTYTINNNTGVPAGTVITLMPQLPEGEGDTGNWLWNTGETTRNLSIIADKSYVYRVTYTNMNGVKSQLSFSIAVQGDCIPTEVAPSITYDGETIADSVVNVLYGNNCQLTCTPECGWGTYEWSDGRTTQSIVVSSVVEDKDYSVEYTNQGGAVSSLTFHIHVVPAEPYIMMGSSSQPTSEVIVSAGSSLTLGLTLPSVVNASSVKWNTGDQGSTLTLNDIQTSGTYTASFSLNGEMMSSRFSVLVRQSGNISIEEGNYFVVEAATGRLLTSHGNGKPLTFEAGDMTSPIDGQTWYVKQDGGRHAIISLPDSLGVQSSGKLGTVILKQFFVEQPVESDYIAFHTGMTASTTKYWYVNKDGSIDIGSQTLTQYPFLFVPVGNQTGIGRTDRKQPYVDTRTYDLQGRLVKITNRHGLYIIGKKKFFK